MRCEGFGFNCINLLVLWLVHYAGLKCGMDVLRDVDDGKKKSIMWTREKK